MRCRFTRRDLLLGTGSSLLLSQMAPKLSAASPRPPTAPVCIARCTSYNTSVVYSSLRQMAQRIGGLPRLVARKTVAVKINLTGDARWWMLGLPPWQTYETHPNVVIATATLLDSFGARRIRFVEGSYQTQYPLEQYLIEAGWDLQPLSSLKAAVEFEDTRNLGEGKTYTQVKVPGRGSLFPAYDLNHSYVDCDVFISLAKLKNHINAGVSLGMKNCFGITPTALYSQDVDDENSTSNRSAIIHTGQEGPPAGVPQEVANPGPQLQSYRVPKCIVDLVRRGQST